MNRVSVVMSVYNGANFLPAAIDSILNQTFPHFDFIIVDDGSTDRSAEIIGSYKDPRIVLVRQKNQGVATALNHGLKHTTGEYIARQDADDISLRERFARQVQYLDAHPEVAVLGTAALIIDSHGRPFSKFLPFTRQKRLVAELLRGVCPLMHGSVMVRREALLHAGGYRPVFDSVEDIELWLRMSARYRLANLREVLYQYRRHDHSMQERRNLRTQAFAMAKKFSTSTSAEEWARFVEEFERNFAGSGWERTSEAESLLRKAQMALAQGNPWRTVQCLAGALQLYPGLATELPGRVFRRLWRTLFPMIG